MSRVYAPSACWPGVSKISKRRKDGRSQRLPLANNLPANNAADGGWAEHGAHNGRGWPYRQGFGVKGLARQCRLGAGLPPTATFRALFAALGAREILRTTAGVSLDGRARHGAIRTEHATVARQRLQALSASFAVIEELARVRRHGFRRPMSTPRTGQCQFRNQARLSIHRLQPELASNISTMALFRMASRPFAEMCHRTRCVWAFWPSAFAALPRINHTALQSLARFCKLTQS